MTLYGQIVKTKADLLEFQEKAIDLNENSLAVTLGNSIALLEIMKSILENLGDAFDTAESMGRDYFGEDNG